jgi:hypothetical protein
MIMLYFSVYILVYKYVSMLLINLEVVIIG